MDRIQLDLAARTADEVIGGLTSHLADVPGVVDAGRLRREILAREAITPTALANGVALPHARTTAVERIVLAAGRSTAGIKFVGCVDPVRLVFLIATPPAMVREYLVLVAALLRTVRREGGRAALLAATDEDEFVRCLQGERT